MGSLICDGNTKVTRESRNSVTLLQEKGKRRHIPTIELVDRLTQPCGGADAGAGH